MADPETVAKNLCLRALTGTPKTRQQLADLLADRDVPDDAAEAVLDRLGEVGLIDDEAFAQYVALNARFHALLADMAASQTVLRELERAVQLPFASPSAFVAVQAGSPAARDLLVVAQHDHRQVLEAIELREGARAEALMREHSRIARRNLHDAVRGQGLERMPSVRLIRQRG